MLTDKGSDGTAGDPDGGTAGGWTLRHQDVNFSALLNSCGFADLIGITAVQEAIFKQWH